MKIWTIIWKDTVIRFRDRNALILMFLTPLIMTAIIGAAFGGFASADDSPIKNIPIVIVNHDEGELGETYILALTSTELTEAEFDDDLEAARQAVEGGRARAVVYLPADFSDNLLLPATDSDKSSSTIQVITDPSASATSAIIESLVTQSAYDFAGMVINRQVTFNHIITEKRGASEAELVEIENIFREELESEENRPPIAITRDTVSNANPLAFFAPSMAIFFLMFNVFASTRSILTEQQDGTLARLLCTPTSVSQILLGKLGGSFLIGFLQIVILVIASRLLFNLSWGPSVLALLLMIVATVAAFTSLGAIVAAFAKDIKQSEIMGSIITLIFAALGGNFFLNSQIPEWAQRLSYITLNRWSLDGFTDLTLHGLGLNAILVEVTALLSIAFILFLLATWRFQHRLSR